MITVSSHLVGSLHLCELSRIGQAKLKSNIGVSTSQFQALDHVVSLSSSSGHKGTDSLFHLGSDLHSLRLRGLGLSRLAVNGLGLHRWSSGSDWCISWLKGNQGSCDGFIVLLFCFFGLSCWLRLHTSRHSKN